MGNQQSADNGRRQDRLRKVFLLIGLGWLLLIGWLVWLVPERNGARDWFGGLAGGGWMAWTFPTALFMALVLGLLLIFSWAALSTPETPRRGILRIETTRGDRLFISLLAAAFICLAWLGLMGAPVWGGLGLSFVFALAVFRWV